MGGFLLGFLYVLFTLVCIFLILVVLLQRGEQGGLGGAFGGAGGDTPFGARGDMTWKRTTAVAAGLFIVLAITIGIFQKPRTTGPGGSTPPPADVKVDQGETPGPPGGSQPETPK